MREISIDGTLKDTAVLMHAAGFQVGDYVERKADKVRGQLIEVTNESVKIQMDDPVGVVGRFPLKDFLTKSWVKTSAKPDPVELVPDGLASSFDAFVAARVSSIIQLEICTLTTSHEKLALSTKVCLKPVKGVVCTKSFDKGKFTLVPTTIKINFKAGKPPTGTSVVHVQPSSLLSFWLGPAHLPKVGDNGMIVPFWHMQKDSDEWNMEITMVKVVHDGYKLQIPVARNIKPLKAGDWLVLKKVDAEDVEQPPSKRAKK